MSKNDVATLITGMVVKDSKKTVIQLATETSHEEMKDIINAGKYTKAIEGAEYRNKLHGQPNAKEFALDALKDVNANKIDDQIELVQNARILGKATDEDVNEVQKAASIRKKQIGLESKETKASLEQLKKEVQGIDKADPKAKAR